MTWLPGWAAALSVHATALADAGSVAPTSAAHGGELETFVQLFLAGFIAHLIVQALAAFRRLRADFKSVQRP